MQPTHPGPSLIMLASEGINSGLPSGVGIVYGYPFEHNMCVKLLTLLRRRSWTLTYYLVFWIRTAFHYIVLSAVSKSDVTHQPWNMLLYWLAMLYYEYFITLPEEIKYIWQRKLSPVSSIFVLNRYTSLLGYIPVLCFYMAPTLGFNAWVMRYRKASDTSVTCTFRCFYFDKVPGVLGLVTQSSIVGKAAVLSASLMNTWA